MTTSDPLTISKSRIATIAERVANDFGAFAFDGLGIMLSDEQLQAHHDMRGFGPRVSHDEPKFHFISGGTRGGKTVLLCAGHTDTVLYKRGLDTAQRLYWRNYQYKTLACAPTTELTLKLWQVFDEVSKGTSDAQWDRDARRSRGGAFLSLFRAGKMDQWPVVRFENGGRVDFRSTEGYAYRLEGDKWWFFSWDEWASQPDREIQFIKDDVLLSRSRDHDAKIAPAAWPKAATERHLIEQIRRVEKGATDTAIHYISSERAFFTNQASLEVERGAKTKASWQRTVLGQPAGGASVEFKADVVENALDRSLPHPRIPNERDLIDFRTFSAWDVGLAHDSTVGGTFLVPKVGVTVHTPAILANTVEIRGGDELTLDHIAFAIRREQEVYGSRSAVDSSGLGGVAAFRQLRDLRPTPLSFVAKSNHRIYGNMRLAAITNGIDMLTWGRPAGTETEPDDGRPWGLIRIPYVIELIDQLANFDRDAKNVPDDWVWMFLIGLWYIRRYWVVGKPPHQVVRFDPRRSAPIARRKAYSLRRG